jgi:hypothetical protein
VVDLYESSGYGSTGMEFDLKPNNLFVIATFAASGSF